MFGVVYNFGELKDKMRCCFTCNFSAFWNGYKDVYCLNPKNPEIEEKYRPSDCCQYYEKEIKNAN